MMSAHVVRVGPRVPRLGSRPRLCRPVALVAEDDGSGGLGGDGSDVTFLGFQWDFPLFFDLSGKCGICDFRIWDF